MLGAWHEVWSQLTADISTRHEVWSQLTADISTREPLPLCTRRVHRVGTWQSDAEGHNQHASVNDCTHFCLPGVPDHWSRLRASALLHVHLARHQHGGGGGGGREREEASRKI